MRPIFLLLGLIGISIEEWLSTVGRITPTGGIGMSKQVFKATFNINVLEKDGYNQTFIMRIFFHFSKLFDVQKYGMYPSDVFVDGQKFSGYTLFYGLEGASYVDVKGIRTYAKGNNITVYIGDVMVKETCEFTNFSAEVMILENEDQTLFSYTRVQMPIHVYSFVASEANNTKIVTRFTSSIGFQHDGRLVFVYPDCMSLPEDVSMPCSELDWFVAEKGIKSNAKCNVTGQQQLTIYDLELAYPESRRQPIRFAIQLNKQHSCLQDDYLNVIVQNGREKVQEEGVLFGFDSKPRDEDEVSEKENVCLKNSSTKLAIGFVVMLFSALITL